MATASRFLVCCSTALAAGCCGPAWPPGGVERQAVAIDNPAAVQLCACCDADGDGDVRIELGSAARITTKLPCGAWWIDAFVDGRHWQLPLPLHRQAVRPATLELTVTPPPATAPLPGFVWIPPGPAVCGDVLGIGQEIERPARVQSFPGFWLGAHEVTNAEFAAFLDACGDAIDPLWLDLDSQQCHLRRGTDGHWHSDAPQLPVVTIAHAGALAYCAHRTAVTGLVHRLPSEWEWEKAARGPRSSTYAYGDVYRQAAANQESGELRPVGSHAENGFGLFDMTGNAFEWVADVHPAADGANPGGATPGYRVLRGGSFVLDGIYLRNSLRMKLRPGVRADDVGFRVLLETTPP